MRPPEAGSKPTGVKDSGIHREDAEGAPQPEAALEPSRQDAGGDVPDRRVLILVGLCGLAALLLDVVFFVGTYGSDGNMYLEVATLLSRGERPNFEVFGAARLAVVLPMAAALLLFDGALPAVDAVFIGYHLLLIVLIYLLGKTLHHRMTGVVAAALTAVCPLLVMYASMPLPDIPLTCFIVGSMILVANSAKAFKADHMKRAMVLALLGGVVLMLGCTAKVSAAVVAPVFAVYLATIGGGRQIKRAVALGLCFSFAFFVVFGIDRGMMHLSYENVSAGRFGKLMKMQENSDKEVWISRGMYYPSDRLQTAAGNIRQYMGGWFTWIAAVSVLVYPFLRRRSWLLFAALVWGFLYRTLGSAALTSYAPHSLQPRYFTVYIVMTTVMSGYLVATVWRRVQKLRRHRRLVVTATLVLFAVGSGMTLYHGIRKIDARLGSRYQYSIVQGTRKALELAKTAFPCWPVVMQPGLHEAAWPLQGDGDVSPWLVSSGEEIFADRQGQPFEFLYVCRMIRTFARHDEMLQCGLGAKNAVYTTGDFVVHQERIGLFSSPTSRLDAIRYHLLGGALPPPQPRDKKVVYLWKVVIRPTAPAEPRQGGSVPMTVRNSGFEEWRRGNPVGWRVPKANRDHLSKADAGSIDGSTAIALGPIGSNRFRVHLFQDIVLDRSLGGQYLVVSSDVRTSLPNSAHLLVEIRRTADGSVCCRESAYHPGDGRWHKMRASVGVPLGGTQETVRIFLLKHMRQKTALFDNVEISVTRVVESSELDATGAP